MNILVWHVHGSWTTAFVQGPHRYLLPTLPERGPWGGGRAAAWDWPESAVEVAPEELPGTAVDVVVVQRPEEFDLARTWLRRDVPVVYLEQNAPRGPAATSIHPVADRDDLLLVHVTAFNELMWDNGSTPTVVVEHGIVDPGHLWTGERAAAATCINEPVRRNRVTGTDLLARFAADAPLDVFGMGTGGISTRDTGTGAEGRVRAYGDLPQHELHTELARRRVYLHTARWTSLGLSLIEAMTIGLPAVAVASTAAPGAIPARAGVCSADVAVLGEALRHFVSDPDAAATAGAAARAFALDHFGLERFLHDWDVVLDRAAGHRVVRPTRSRRAVPVPVPAAAGSFHDPRR
ncbi:MAG: glycosyltransferase [Pseudonocardia sp.]|uniref:glycosyltransferase n=1 Tax=unclassified Pseudonocardia TaxID=2619320 RepID=UPI00086BA58E|nr:MULTISPECIES: glycosyltransferase [unclassified Pseudonocardia]MBN9107289.1 glycosyltransferase [Pseudonocardia sp.]ODU27029.1 MAG: glycosyl transferase [Pseudonocardia sp. SCN 72-51]ODV06544.1 MAG: glycosyl transferase [Pseudonocardia sp. SCN 73-27]